MPVSKLLREMSSAEISEWMAYDLTNNETWLKAYKDRLELEQSKNMSDEDKLRAFKRLLGGQ